jgi:hypothetical protein
MSFIAGRHLAAPLATTSRAHENALLTLHRFSPRRTRGR